MFSVSAFDPDRNSLTVNFDTVPDQCPICHRNVHVQRPVDHGFVSQRQAHGGVLQILYRCPSTPCGLSFIATYRSVLQGGTRDTYYFFLERLDPRTAREPAISEPVRKVSPAFVTIYGQALQAEKSGLDQIAGCGFRRAVEFLIKDYLIHKNPADADRIRQMFLGNCISTYISDENIKACAARATWLGNDQTHYERRYELHDINHLKGLIDLTQYWISSELLTQKYKEDIPDKA
jgi:hypothetical protein